MKIANVISFILLSTAAQFSSAAAAEPTPICAGQTVYAYNGKDLVGQVVGVYGDEAEVRWMLVDGLPFSGRLSYRLLEDLAPQVQCHEGVCEGAVVYGYTGSDWVGRVKRVFENGEVEVKWFLRNGESYSSGKLSYWNTENLSVRTRCLDGLCEGDRVHGNNGRNHVGTIRKIFDNGQVEVLWQFENGASREPTLGYWLNERLNKIETCSKPSSGECH